MTENLFEKKLFVLLTVSVRLKGFKEVKGLVRVVKRVSQSTLRTSFPEPVW